MTEAEASWVGSYESWKPTLDALMNEHDLTREEAIAFITMSSMQAIAQSQNRISNDLVAKIERMIDREERFFEQEEWRDD